MALPAAHDIHLARRLWHFFGVLAMAFLEWILPDRQALAVALLAGGFMVAYDFARLNSRRLNRFFHTIFGAFLREKEKRRLAGSTFMMIGIATIVALFPKNVALLTMLMFAIADPLASYFGIRFGKDKLIGNKSLQGSLAAFCACFAVSLLFYSSQHLMVGRTFIACLLTGLIGAASELVPVGKLDDNLVFPILTATLLSGLFYIFEGL